MKPNSRQKMDGLKLLRALDAPARAVVFDPQYRGVLDHLAYGNEGVSRQIARTNLKQMSDAKIAEFINEIGRVLAPTGHLFFWIDKFSLGRGIHLQLLTAAPQIQCVDVIHWNRLTFGMGVRSRTVSEYLIVAQRHPIRAKGVWTDHGIRDSWPEKASRRGHPHAKPLELTKRLIKCVTHPGDLVVDPAAGGYTTLRACKETGREFIGCDIA